MITNADLFAMAMESDTAYRLMPDLCKLLGTSYPIGMSYPPSHIEQPKEKEHDQEFAN